APRASPRAQAVRLERLEVADARDLEPAALARAPDLQVVLLRLREAQVAGAHEQLAVRQAQGLEQRLRDRDHLLERLVAPLGRGELHHLDLVELVYPVEAAHVLAVAARLAAEAGRVGAVAQRQGGGVE